MQDTSARISRHLARFNIRNVHILAKRNTRLLRHVKDDLGLKAVPGTYCIQCEYGKVYIGQMGHTIEMKCKQQTQHICQYQLYKSVVAEHRVEAGHCINFKVTIILARMASHMDHLVKEAIEIQLHPDTFNEDTTFTLS
jgi:hypothetical protein